MNENRVKRNSMLAQKLIKELKDRNIEAFYAEGGAKPRSLHDPRGQLCRLGRFYDYR